MTETAHTETTTIPDVGDTATVPRCPVAEILYGIADGWEHP